MSLADSQSASASPSGFFAGTSMQPSPPVQVFWQLLGRLFVQLLGERAHVQIIITLRDGAIQPVHINRTFQPGDLPKVP